MTFSEKKFLFKWIFLAEALLLLLVIVLAANYGAADISFKQTLLIIMSKIPFVGKYVPLTNINESSIIILINLRLPRIILACLVGMALSVVGTSFQGIFKNPMADPYVLGVSSGAALGATITLVFLNNSQLLGIGILTISAFVGAITTTLLVYNVARVGKKIPTATLLLAGISINYLLSSIIALIMSFKREQMESIIMWTMGSFSTASWNEVHLLFFITLPSVILIYIFSRDLNLMLLGEESARSLGINVEGFKKYILVISTILIAAVVSVSGIIGFVGLIIPHTARMLIGSDNRFVIPFSAMEGAIFLIICDTLARSLVPPSEIPVGIITSTFGVPFFILLLYRAKKKVF